jgi:type II secretory pathway pseudopilin PulG
MKKPKLTPQPKGFALVITLMLMIILTVVAVGLLSLSSISIRTSSQSQAMATARANARLALMLALGDLQKSLGPDRAITANSDILEITPNTIKKYNTAGVWESWWDFNPNSSPTPDYVAQKTSRFRRWLVSSADPTANLSRDFALAAWPSDAITLVGGGSLGVADNAKTRAIAGRVNISAGKSKGAYAWHVADESLKARINAYRDPTKNTTLAEKTALLAGHRPDPSVIDPSKLDFLPTDNGPTAAERSKNYKEATEIAQKVTDLGQFDLVKTAANPSSNNRDKIKPYRNDVTPYSLGVLTDVRHGGLKQDLSSVFEMSDRNNINLPPEFSGKKLYQSTHGVTGLSDPYWNTLAGYYNIFRNIDTLESKPTLASPINVDSFTENKVPKTYFPGPVIAKVETVFSLVTREDVSSWMGAGWAEWTIPIRKKTAYTVNLIFSPQITLHNPYNVKISFNRMKVTLNNVPVAFKFSLIRGGSSGTESQSVDPTKFESLNQMIQNTGDIDPSITKSDGSHPKVNENRKFVVHLGNWKDTDLYTDTSPTTGDIVMNPGQTLVFYPFLPTGLTFDTDSHVNSDEGGSEPTVVFFDYKSRVTSRGIKAKPGIRPGMGFELNNITPSHRTGKALRSELTPDEIAKGDGDEFWWFLLRDNSLENPGESNTALDRYFVEYKIQQPSYWPNGVDIRTAIPTPVNPSFEVSATIKTSATSAETPYANLVFNYKVDDTPDGNSVLERIFGSRVYRYPPVGSMLGKSETDSNNAFVSQFTGLGSQANAKPFAIFSAYARTSNGGVYETGFRQSKGADTPDTNLLKDGRLAGKPFLFHSPSRAVVTMDLATTKPGILPYELNFQPFLSKGDYDDDLESDTNNRVLALTGNSSGRGIKSGSYLEIPTGPMQTIGDFRRSNVLSSSYLPQFVQPIGNSLLHPLMSPEKVIETNSNVQPEAMLDQSVLANHALYDRFYFSTLATRGANSPRDGFDQFMNLLDTRSTNINASPLLAQSFTPYLPAGKTLTSAKAELFSGDKPSSTAYREAAEYQMIQGPFNVNSTSISAWKAVLAAMKKSDIAIFWARNAPTPEMKPCTSIPILGMSLLNGGKIGDGGNDAQIDDTKSNDWNGFRELNDAQLNILANKIVDQVRLRGPFLSMSEFVNRQIGLISDLSLSGALEKAVADSEINKDFLSGSVTDLKEEDFTNAALYDYKTPKATIGNPAAGAPGWVSQGDLLRILEPAATVRSDTFVIRVCGEAKDSSGSVTATAYAEAVVQRVPEYVDPVNRPSLNAYDQTVPANVTSSASIINKTFGRRMNVVSFRWLSPNEI